MRFQIEGTSIGANIAMAPLSQSTSINFTCLDHPDDIRAICGATVASRCRSKISITVFGNPPIAHAALMPVSS